MNKFYLNGEIIDRHRIIFTGNGAITNRGETSKDRAYFDKYNDILLNRLWKTYNILFSVGRSSPTIFNPFGYDTYCHVSTEWDPIDFFKADIKELCNNYDCMVLLPRWWKCKEAWSKLFIAKGLGIKIITLKKLLKELL